MAKLSIILQTCAYLLSTLVWMAQILPIQHRSERDMVQNYTQLKPYLKLRGGVLASLKPWNGKLEAVGKLDEVSVQIK